MLNRKIRQKSNWARLIAQVCCTSMGIRMTRLAQAPPIIHRSSAAMQTTWDCTQAICIKAKALWLWRWQWPPTPAFVLAKGKILSYVILIPCVCV